MKSLTFFAALWLLCSCTGADRLIKDSASQQRMEAALSERYSLFGEDAEIFSLLKDESIPAQQREALTFLYAYSPIADMNIDHDLIKTHVATTFAAREAMPWGSVVPEAIFLHYVLPARVNNEPLDSSRVVFYKELASRVAGMSIEDAALEVNHWCHEKAVYGPSDGRTLSPIELTRSAVGRCGEESVFAIAAMRAVGIPARQVYTPRWAHSDDNHAWVEIWTPDGWRYLGACEPEAALDMGWFSGPASRALLTHAKVFGDYVGDEDVVSRAPSFTEVNTTSIYADTKRVFVKVVDSKEQPVEGAKVEFRIFNYAEFYPAATLESDKDGLCSVTLGLGDLVVWATKGDQLGIKELSVPVTDTLTVALTLSSGDDIDMEFNLTPPAEGSIAKVSVTEEQKAENSRRMKEEDDIRAAYIASFPTEEVCTELATELGMDSTWLLETIKSSRGNHQTIIAFLKESPAELLSDAKELLSAITKKDLMDISKESLTDHLAGALKYKDGAESELWARYILNPRVSTEAITPYRATFAKATEGKSIEEIIEMVRSVKIADDYNTTAAKIKPEDVAKLGVADQISRDIYFVALARSCGTAARLEERSGKLQYHNGDEWIDVSFGKVEAPQIADRGKIKVNVISPKSVTDPKYSTHFTFAKMDGVLPRTISMRENMNVDMGGGASAKGLFSRPIELDAGRYIASSGTRNGDGEVAAKIASFTIEADKQGALDLLLRESIEHLETIATVDSNIELKAVDGSSIVNVAKEAGSDYILVALIKPKAEPTNHSLRALKSLTSQLEGWSGKVLVAVESDDQWSRYNPNEFGELPVSQYLIDDKSELSKMAAEVGLSEGNLPFYFIMNGKGEVILTSEGYQINLGDNISKTIQQIK